MIINNKKRISVRRKCQLLKLNRSGLYCKSKGIVTGDDVELMNEIRDIYMKHTFYGYRKIHATLLQNAHQHNRKKTQRLMQLAGLKAVCPYKKQKRLKNAMHKVYPYLLKDLVINRPNQVWQVDITYIKIKGGFVYLVCLIDVYSRRIMGWNLSPFLDTDSCIQSLNNAMLQAKPEILNSDQGCQFKSEAWCKLLILKNIQISMDGKGRWADNVYIERLWRTIKYELIYLHQFENIDELRNAISKYVLFYNSSRPHQALRYRTPDQVYKDFEHVINKAKIVEHQLPVYGNEVALLNF